MKSNLVDVVSDAIKKEFYGSDDSRFGHKEARASILAIKEWLQEKEDTEYLVFLFPAIEVLETELEK